MMLPNEAEQVSAIVSGGASVVDRLSLEGRHLDAGRVSALVQLARVLWTRLQSPPPEVAEEDGPCNTV